MKNTSLKLTILAVTMLSHSALSTANSHGQNIVENGKNGTTACAICHGNDGAGNAAATLPRLAGLDKTYLAKQLNDFKTGSRSNPIMNGIASTLSETDINSVSAYLSELNTPAKRVKVSPELSTLGEKLATYGNWDKDIPACFRCHGDQAQGGGSAMPALAGQHQTYIQAQLQSWKSGTRNNDPVGLMTAITSRMSDTEIEAVSAYLSTLSPASTK